MGVISAQMRQAWRDWVQRRIPPGREIQLSQSTIFILPSKEGWIFILSLTAMFIGGVNYGNSLILALTFFLAGLLFVAILNTFRNLSGIILTFESSEAGFVDDFVMYTIRLSSDKTFAHESVEMSIPGLDLQVCSIEPSENTFVQVFVPAQQRGIQRPGRLRIQTVYPVGILKAWSWVDLSLQGIVYPKSKKGPIPLDECNADELGSHVSVPGHDDFSGLNSYQPGDSLSRVYWKVVARGMPLATKSFETPVSEACWLGLDSAEGDLEAKLSVLTYWILTKFETGSPYGLVLGGQKFPVNTGPEHKQACLIALALFAIETQLEQNWDPTEFMSGG